MTARRSLVTVGAMLALAACGTAAGTPPRPSDDVSGAVTVFAAASLRDAFTEIAQRFETEHPGTTVTLNAAGSQRLATQIVEGAPADVFASADRAQMTRVADEGLVAGPVDTFARNRLAIAVEPGNPAGVHDVADLARPGLAVVLAADEVPVGRYARQALDAAGVHVAPVSLEADVGAVLGKVALGEADAGIVYASDVTAADGRVTGVAIPVDRNVTAEYPIAVLADAPNPVAARAFVASVRSAAGRGVLERAGFSAVPAPTDAAPGRPTPTRGAATGAAAVEATSHPAAIDAAR